MMACLLAEIKSEIRTKQAKMDANVKTEAEMKAWRKKTTD
jgi:hypothetical protein